MTPNRAAPPAVVRWLSLCPDLTIRTLQSDPTLLPSWTPLSQAYIEALTEEELGQIGCTMTSTSLLAPFFRARVPNAATVVPQHVIPIAPLDVAR